MSLFEVGRPVTHIPAFAREVYDVTGAGDTVMAVLALALAAGATMREAAVLANHGAGVVVAKRGTATVSRAELARALEGGQPSK
jgi:D-beta-D-heptose 7-phosphate kinase/D-beta-D-heptose 1-phosphate adenosyltransferase